MAFTWAVKEGIVIITVLQLFFQPVHVLNKVPKDNNEQLPEIITSHPPPPPPPPQKSAHSMQKMSPPLGPNFSSSSSITSSTCTSSRMSVYYMRNSQVSSVFRWCKPTTYRLVRGNRNVLLQDPSSPHAQSS